MIENLSEMVKSGNTENYTNTKYDTLPEKEEVIEVPEVNSIPITSLGKWFNSNANTFLPHIKKTNVAVQGINPDEQLILNVCLSNEGGVEKRKLIIYDDAHIQPVLNLPAMDMKVYNNGFRIIYNFGNDIFIKSYNIKTGLISVFCNDIDDKLIPYSIVKAKKRDNKIDVVLRNPAEVRTKLNERLDFEALQLRYKQSSKSEGLVTNGDAINWLLDRLTSIEDIYHHLQIDNVIIDTLQ